MIGFQRLWPNLVGSTESETTNSQLIMMDARENA